MNGHREARHGDREPRPRDAKRLLDHVKDQSFQFQRVAGPDVSLVGTRDTDEWTDTVYLDGFSRGCYALRERRTSLVVPGQRAG